jgi:hypothetical protein
MAQGRGAGDPNHHRNGVAPAARDLSGRCETMTEHQWLSAKDPLNLWYTPPARHHCKRRLVACACARRVLAFLNDPPQAVALIEACERYTRGPDRDGPKNWTATLAARRAFRTPFDALRRGSRGSARRGTALRAVWMVSEADANSTAPALSFARYALHGRSPTPWVPERVAQLAIFRDVFGNPFRPVTVRPSGAQTPS